MGKREKAACRWQLTHTQTFLERQLEKIQLNAALNNLKIEFGYHDAHWRRIIANTLLVAEVVVVVCKICD